MTEYSKATDGHTYVYRRISSRLERRDTAYSMWSEVTGPNFLAMTPKELRHVADVLEGIGGEE